MNVGAASPLFPVRDRVAQLALSHRLAGITTSSYAEKRLLMNYGADILAVSRRAAVFVDKILKALNPVELPSRYDFAVNIRTAQALGLIIPPDVAAQVTQWIE